MKKQDQLTELTKDELNTLCDNGKCVIDGVTYATVDKANQDSEYVCGFNVAKTENGYYVVDRGTGRCSTSLAELSKHGITIYDEGVSHSYKKDTQEKFEKTLIK